MRRVDQCPACGGRHVSTIATAGTTEITRFIEYSDRKYGGIMTPWLRELELVVLRCGSCRHHWYRDQPDEPQLASMYEAAGPWYGERAITNVPTEAIRTDMRRFRRLFSDSNPSLLDYGSGRGQWAHAAVAVGFDVVAFEPSRQRSADEGSPFVLVHETCQISERRFDAINVEQVLEHVPEPLRVLQEIRSLCASTAIVRIAVPNIDRAHEGRDLWKTWPFSGDSVHTLAPFEHLHGFTGASLDRVVTRAGFKRIALRRLGLSFLPMRLRHVAGLVWPSLSQTLTFVQPAT